MKAHDLLTAHQRDVGARVIAEESARREHVVVYLSGAHAYGFPSPDSDLDLKAIHAAPTREIVGLREHKPTFDRAEVIEGVEIDYTSNELGPALRGVLAGNGNFIERVLGATPLAVSPALDALRPLVAAALARRVHGHAGGSATRQRAAAARRPTAKRVLYVLRTTLTGAHLLATGELVTDVTELLDARGLGAARELVERKRAGEQTPLAGDELVRWRAELVRAFDALDAAERTSQLPLEPRGAAELEAWLVDLRRAGF